VPRIAIVADYDPSFPPHPATSAALVHTAQALKVDLTTEWLPTEPLAAEGWQHRLEPFHGFFIGPGSPYKSLQGGLNAVRFARESGRPLIATCGGFQHVVIEYARNVMGFSDAQHAEYDPYASCLFISALVCSLASKALLIDILPDTLAFRAYGCAQAQERYYCNFGINPEYRQDLENAGLVTAGVEAGEEQSRGESRILELPNHPFFLATLFVPQARSTPTSTHPLVDTFMSAVISSA